MFTSHANAITAVNKHRDLTARYQDQSTRLLEAEILRLVAEREMTLVHLLAENKKLVDEIVTLEEKVRVNKERLRRPLLRPQRNRSELNPSGVWD